MANRIDRVNSLLEREIGNILLKEFSLPGVMATISRVDVTPNLIEARAYISVFPESKARKVISELKKEVRVIQKKINKKLNMRPIPKIIFVRDENIEEAAKIESLLDTLKKDEK